MVFSDEQELQGKTSVQGLTKLQAQKLEYARMQQQQQQQQQQRQSQPQVPQNVEAQAQTNYEREATQSNMPVRQAFQGGKPSPNREIAPGALKENQTGNVRSIASNLEQEAYQQGGFKQKESTSDQFTIARDIAMKKGSFDYGSILARSSSYTTPTTFVNEKGQVVSSPTQTSAPNDLVGLTTRIIQPRARQTPKTGSAPLVISSLVLEKSDAIRKEAGLPPLEQVMNVKVVQAGSTPIQTGSNAPIVTFEGKSYSYNDLFNNPNVKEYKSIDVALKGGGFTSEIVQVPYQPAPTPGQNKSSVNKSPLPTITTPTGTVGTETINGKTFKTFTPNQKQTSEVSSFLKIPFVGNKVSSGGIPSTSLIDLAVFLPIPLGIAEKVSAVIKPVESLFLKEFSGVAEAGIVKEAKVTRIGTADIGTNVSKYTEKFKTQKNTQDLIREKALATNAEIKNAQSTTNVNLGVGLGKIIPKEGGTSSLDILGKGPGERPTLGPTEKTVSVGKGLEQIIKQKEEIKTEQKTEQKTPTKTETIQSLLEKEMKKKKPKTEQEKNAQKFEELVEKQKEESATKEKIKSEETKSEQEQTLTEKAGIGLIRPARSEEQKEEQSMILLINQEKTQKSPQKQEPRSTAINIIGSITTPKPRQGQKLTVTPILNIPTPTKTSVPPINKPPVTNTPPAPTKTPTPEEVPTNKKLLDEMGSTLGGSLTGGGGRPEAFGLTRTFRGNVPINNIVGVYKRNEISYNPRVVNSRDILSNDRTEKFVKNRKKGKIF